MGEEIIMPFSLGIWTQDRIYIQKIKSSQQEEEIDSRLITKQNNRLFLLDVFKQTEDF